MKYSVEIAKPDSDYEALATFMNTFEPDPISAADLREWDKRNAENILRRCIVKDEAGIVIGYSVALSGPWNADGEFYFWFNVEKAHRGEGIGQQLYENGLAFIQSHSGTSLTTEVGDDEADGVRFAEARGFTKLQHTFQSKLDLKLFDEG